VKEGCCARGPNQRVPSNRPTGCSGLRPLSSSRAALCLAREDATWGKGTWGGVGGLYYIYEALSKQSNNIDSAPRGPIDHLKERPASGPFLCFSATFICYRRAHGALILFTRALSTPTDFLFHSPFAFKARRMRSNRHRAAPRRAAHTFSPA
jgi:hypothetical protein